MRKAMLLFAILGLAGSLWAGDLQVGTWKLNLAQSKVPPSYRAPRKATFVFRTAGDQIEWVLTATDASGSPVTSKGAYPREGGVVKWSVAPAHLGDTTIISTVVSPYESYQTFLRDGKQERLDHVVVSNDGATTRETIKGMGPQGRPFKVLLVFDKQ
ncbi:MAG: hypothetical protein ACRD4R_09880 [Candidatus Acidiferrales bacterium]